MQRLQQESCGIPLLLDVHREENSKSALPCSSQKEMTATVWETVGGHFFFAAICRAKSSLDNPRADVYNKDKERRCPHSGQLPSSGVTLENMTATVWKRWAVIFLVIF